MGETFVDRGNGLFDNEEEYNLRLNADGTSDTLLYKIGEKPDNLVVDWADPTTPRVLLNINLGDDITTLSLIHISEHTRPNEIAYAVFCL